MPSERGRKLAHGVRFACTSAAINQSIAILFSRPYRLRDQTCDVTITVHSERHSQYLSLERKVGLTNRSVSSFSHVDAISENYFLLSTQHAENVINKYPLKKTDLGETSLL